VSPSSTMWTGPRPTSMPSGILIHAAVWRNRHVTQIGPPPGSASFLGEGGAAGSPSNTESPGLRPTFVPSAILIHPAVWRNRHGTKIGRSAGFVLLFGKRGGRLGPHLIQSRLGCGLPSCQVASLSLQPFGHNKHGPKIWGLRPPFVLGSGSGVPI